MTYFINFWGIWFGGLGERKGGQWFGQKLEPGELTSLYFPRASRVKLRALGKGPLWITLEGDNKDYFLWPESPQMLDVKGKLVAEAPEGANLIFEFFEFLDLSRTSY